VRRLHAARSGARTRRLKASGDLTLLAVAKCQPPPLPGGNRPHRPSAPVVREDIHPFACVRRTAPPGRADARASVGECTARLVRGIVRGRERRSGVSLQRLPGPTDCGRKTGFHSFEHFGWGSGPTESTIDDSKEQNPTYHSLTSQESLLTPAACSATLCSATMFSARTPRKPLSELEHLVMGILWDRRSATTEDVRAALAQRHPMKESTVRTILKRLEQKGYVQHAVEGRTNVYAGVDAPHSVAAGAVRQIIDRFCGGSVEQLLVGMVNNDVVDERELQRLAQRIARRKKGGKEA